jgi:hypothetical protein
MVYFQTKNPNLGKFWRELQWNMLVYFMDIWFILWPLGLFHSNWVYFVVIWYIFPVYGMWYQEKSGNPGTEANRIFFFREMTSLTHSVFLHSLSSVWEKNQVNEN